ncbi:MAG TPA: folylpolyglutamate synthase/dihydrofolate synthase family protein [Thermoanaerobaculia bacterium]|nr:folylpolyglutamate synthase/dihydrofolate synthase family protein [Thermoanaerobaculia bacterium]
MKDDPRIAREPASIQSPELAWLDSLQASGIRPGLSRVRSLLRHAGNPHRQYPSLIVAGTNGKGSVSANLASILSASGYKVGLYTSPHLVELRERWLIGGVPVGMATLIDAIVELERCAARAGFAPTYFEALTVVAFILFARTNCDAVVLEVGMGGRLDATNVVKPVASVITPISLDHTEFLGDTVTKVAREKAGVIHPGSVVLTSNSSREIVDVLRRKALKVKAPFHLASEQTSVSDLSLAEGRTAFRLVTAHASYAISSALAGAHQVSNLTLAVRTAEELASRFDRITVASITRGIEETKWRGRFERFAIAGRSIFVDGAHNVSAAEAIVPSIEQLVVRPRTLVFGIMADKDVESVARILFPHFDRLILTIPYAPRAASLEDLTAIAGSMGISASSEENPDEAFEVALAGGSGSIVICGSLYLAGAAIAFLDARRATPNEAMSVSSDSENATPTA